MLGLTNKKHINIFELSFEMQENSHFKANWKKLLENEIKLRGFSQKTYKNYYFYINKFLESNLSPEKYLLKLINCNKHSETVRQAGFAIKFYLRITKQFSKLEFPNVKKSKKLPIVLSKKDIENMIKITNNLKHKLIIQMLYSSGMRVSEITNLEWKDIDFKRNIIHIKLAKGKKDRIVMLSKKVKKGLKTITEIKNYVFLTTRKTKYNIRTIEKIISNCAKKANIKQNVTPHTLRHSFATHLLENGTDIRYIKDLLGHKDINTTLIYTKVSNKNISKIKSPLD